MSIKQAIEALEELVEYAEEAGFDWSLDNARAALAALRSMPQGEPDPAPLFYYRPCMDGLYEGPHHARSVLGKMLREERPNDWHPLYATQHTEAVRMSEAEILEIMREWPVETNVWADHIDFARAVEQATAARLGVTLGDV